MLPDLIVPVTALPRTTSGKIDLQAMPLPAPTEAKVVLDPHLGQVGPAAEGDAEAVLAIWSRVLHVDDLNVETNFFALGGDSLRAFRVAVMIRQQFGIKFRVSDVFDRPTVASQTALVAERRIATTE
jgi:acyl carrier protein